MYKTKKNQMAIVHAIKKKKQNKELLCATEIYEKSVWKDFLDEVECGELVLYGAGELFDYFCEVYGTRFEIKYAVDQKSRGEKNGVTILDPQILSESTSKTVVLITMINHIDDVMAILKTMGIKKMFSLVAMENKRLSIKAKVAWARINPNYTYKYQMEYLLKTQMQALQRKSHLEVQRVQNELNDIKKKNRRMELWLEGLQKRQSERYLYFLHTNRMLNVLIEKSGDMELKKEQIRYVFQYRYGNQYVPDFDNPTTFNEKINHRNLYDYNPLYTYVSDKLSLKEYVAEKVGKEYIVPVLKVWKSPEDIVLEDLPEKFVFKATSGGDASKVIVVQNKNELDMVKIKEVMKEWLCPYTNDYYSTFNWSFKEIEQQIFAEEYIGEEDEKYVYDYKIYTFHGEPKYVTLSTVEFLEDGKTDIKITYMDMNWEKVDIKRNHEDVDDIQKPIHYDEMIKLTTILAEPFEFVRVDFMETKKQLYVSELTLTPGGGLVPFEPMEWDYKFGELW